jgi:2,3-bisphosphoglycerate-independent phosphoglycerate mutase
MKLLFLFMDGVGLGQDDPQRNPFARARMPALQDLLEGERMLYRTAPLETRRASLLALDACLGVPGLPQSATGQTVLLTGQNVPALLGYHYGPKPNPPVAEFLANGNLFSRLNQAGRRTAFLNAFPPGYFDGIHSGRRLYAAIAQAAVNAGLPLGTLDDLRLGRALSADFTAQGWRERLGMPDTPVLAPNAAGQRLAELATEQDFSLFEYWLSDYAGHSQDMDAASRILESFDQVLAGLLAGWDDSSGLILLTSDHGNLEDLSTRRHTANPVPALVIGAPELRHRFTTGLHDLTGVAPAIMDFVV